MTAIVYRVASMAGIPRKRAIVLALQRRAERLLGDDAHGFDYAVDWLASGGTIASLAREIENPKAEGCEPIGFAVSREVMRQSINISARDKGLEQEQSEKEIAKARAQGAAGMVETAVGLIDDASEHRDSIAKAKAQADIRNWYAGKVDRETWGEKNSPLVAISVSDMHLGSLQSESFRSALAQAQQINNPLLGSGQDAQVVEAEEDSE